MTKRSHAARLQPLTAVSAVSTPQQLIANEREARARACVKDLDEILIRYNCRLQAQVVIIGDRVQSAVNIIPMDVTE